jgi:hypothetical protein
MGLRDLVKKNVVGAFKAIGDLKDEVTYYHVTTGAYDPESDQLTNTVTAETFQCVQAKLSDLEVDYFPGPLITERLIVPYNVFTGEPKEPDYVCINNVRWEVRRARGVPGASVWIIYIQQN